MDTKQISSYNHYNNDIVKMKPKNRVAGNNNNRNSLTSSL